jgi:glycosyltransferase involved in cell wall biosynthesis
MDKTKINVLIVCQWPLGGIRTYLKYVYSLFPMDEFEVTILANPTTDQQSLTDDMSAAGIKIIWARPILTMRSTLSFWTMVLLLRERYDIIHSQGFISAVHVALVNWLFRIPHVLTIHGIVEDKYFKGSLSRIKHHLLYLLLRNITIFHGVGNDILEHFKNVFPALQKGKARWVTIVNGIRPEKFLIKNDDAPRQLRIRLGVSRETAIFGFFGRFMPQKGFSYIIEAAAYIKREAPQHSPFIVLAVGSGDYEKEYKKDVIKAGLEDMFIFHPFDPQVVDFIKGCDAVLMPSDWEAYPILTSEVFCCGIPLIASDCIGLREATRHTPALVVPAGDAVALAEKMVTVMTSSAVRQAHQTFRVEAAERFDVKHSAEKLLGLFREVQRRVRTVD